MWEFDVYVIHFHLGNHFWSNFLKNPSKALHSAVHYSKSTTPPTSATSSNLTHRTNTNMHMCWFLSKLFLKTTQLI